MLIAWILGVLVLVAEVVFLVSLLVSWFSNSP